MVDNISFVDALAQLVVEERLSPGLAGTLSWGLENYIGMLAYRRLNLDHEVQLKQLTFGDFLYLLRFNVLMLYMPGLGPKRMRELRLAVKRFIDEHNLDYDFPEPVQFERRRRF